MGNILDGKYTSYKLTGCSTQSTTNSAIMEEEAIFSSLQQKLSLLTEQFPLNLLPPYNGTADDGTDQQEEGDHIPANGR